MDSSKPRRSRPSARPKSKPRRRHSAAPSGRPAAAPAVQQSPAHAEAREGAPASDTRAAVAGSQPAPLRGAIRLLPYQQRWVADCSPLKIVVKARQIGYSYAATARAVLDCIQRKTTWIFLSKGERQSRLLMEKVAEHVRSFGLVARVLESTYFEGTLTRQLETRFPNGSVIYGLPANPDTARGYTGNVTLDEFAFHADAAKIYAALFPTITRGYGLEIISTPNGTQGKFYELAKAAGLTESEVENRKLEIGRTRSRSGSPTSYLLLPTSSSKWSPHRCDIYDAVRQGLKIDISLLRSGCEDETAWQQEFCCAFVSTAENFFPPELLAASLSAEASLDTPSLLLASARGARGTGVGSRELRVGKHESREFFLGIDVGRKHDRTVFWVDETGGTGARDSGLGTGGSDRTGLPAPGTQHQTPQRISIARLVKTFSNAPFSEQLAFARELLSLREGNGLNGSPAGRPLISRVAIDATGIGLPLAESLAQEFGPRVEPVVFTAAMKEDLAFRTRRRMEEGLTLLPDAPEVRRAFSAVKKFVTPAGNLRFDAARTEAGHADEFWAKALADYAADCRPVSTARDAYLADGSPIVDPRAFAIADAGFLGLEF